MGALWPSMEIMCPVADIRLIVSETFLSPASIISGKGMSSITLNQFMKIMDEIFLWPIETVSAPSSTLHSSFSSTFNFPNHASLKIIESIAQNCSLWSYFLELISLTFF